MNNLKYIFYLVIVVLGAWFFLRSDGCNRIIEKKILVHDSVPYAVFINTVEIRDTGSVRKVYIPQKADSTVLRGLLAQIDSLNSILKTENVASFFSMDTVTKENDKIHVDCDEVSKAIALKIEFGKREVMIKTEREVIIQTEKPKFSIGIGGGGVFLIPDGLFKYGITMNLQYNFITF